MPRKSSTNVRTRSSVVTRGRRKSSAKRCHAYIYPEEEFFAGKDVDGRVARSLYNLAVGPYKDEIIRHAKMDIRRCCNGLVSGHKVLMAVNWQKPHSFGTIFNMCYRTKKPAILSYQIPPLEHNAIIRSFIDAPAQDQPFANMTNFNKNKRDLAKYLRDNVIDDTDLDISDDAMSSEDEIRDSDGGHSLNTNLELMLHTLSRLQDDIGSVLKQKGKGKAKEVKPIPSRLSTPESFPSQSQLIKEVCSKRKASTKFIYDAAAEMKREAASATSSSSRSSSSMHPSNSVRVLDDGVIVLSDDEE